MKIEKGCMAIVINGAAPNHPKTNIGKIVTVGDFLGKLKGFVGNDRWSVDQLINYTLDGLWFTGYHVQEKNLQRIDEPPDQETITEELEITESA